MKILSVDDHALFRSGLALLLPTILPDARVLEAASLAEGLSAAVAAVDLDLILVDLNLPGVSGMQAVEAFARQALSCRIVALSGQDDAATVKASIDAGACGFIPKASTPLDLVRALTVTLGGGIYLPAPTLELRAGADNRLAAINQLSPRQQDVLHLLIRGHSNKRIAALLAVEPSTVKTHVTAVLRALNAENRTEVVYLAAQCNWRPVGPAQ